MCRFIEISHRYIFVDRCFIADFCMETDLAIYLWNKSAIKTLENRFHI